jgi:hypothetical protein
VHLSAPVTSQEVPGKSLGTSRITVPKSGRNLIVIRIGASARLEIIATTYRSTIFRTHVFSLYSHLCICVSI